MSRLTLVSFLIISGCAELGPKKDKREDPEREGLNVLMKCSCIYPLESDETVFLNHQFVCNYDCSVSEYCGNTIQEANLCTEDYLNIVAVQEGTCFNLDTEGGGRC